MTPATLLSRCAFPPAGTGVVCAVSGGADSLALLALAVEAGCVVTAVHVDHGARPSEAEAGVVAAAAERFGAGFDRRRVQVDPGTGNLEERWRDARRAALPPGALTGHTADDLAETVLLNLTRGAGLDGLAGIRPGSTKPILALRRAETRALCRELGLEAVHDPTNDDPAFRRNRIRHEALPLLDAIAERDVASVLARQARLLREDADLLDALAAGLDPTDARRLAEAPAPLARRVVRRWLGDGRHPPDAATVERVLAVARGETKACELPGGDRVERSRMRLRRVGPGSVEPDG
ncbi:MAG TPA: tRNA lysidine(34) synthetase TilS [Acidimicrobiales bacterium]|nr:tRNA lysidine(34) synthetase TilS [Acidimicrobiales bacterium]